VSEFNYIVSYTTYDTCLPKEVSYHDTPEEALDALEEWWESPDSTGRYGFVAVERKRKDNLP
jgi:hypothetical protein